MSDPALRTRDLVVIYGSGRPALEDLTVEIPRGTMTAVIGPNGAGKSTLFKAVLGLVRPHHGEVEVLGQPLRRQVRRLIGYVPQRDAVDWQFPVTVLEVALMGRAPLTGIFRRLSRQDRELAWEALHTVGMAGYAPRRIGELSGGQQQRVMLARALAQQAEVLLLDEPVSGVDPAAQHEVYDLLRHLQELGKTVLVCSHDLGSVNENFDLALLLNQRVVAFGNPAGVIVPELLMRAYGSHLRVLRRGDLAVAVDDGGGGHHR